MTLVTIASADTTKYNTHSNTSPYSAMLSNCSDANGGSGGNSGSGDNEGNGCMGGCGDNVGNCCIGGNSGNHYFGGNGKGRYNQILYNYKTI